jgi:hypothetical protein
MTGTASATGDDLSAGDADMDTDGTTDTSRHVGYRGTYSQRCTSGSFGIIAVRNGSPEDTHYTVADMLVDAPAMFLDDPIGAIEELLEQGMNLLRIKLLSPRRVAGEIGKQYRYLPTLADRIDLRGGLHPRVSCVIGGGQGGYSQRSDRVEQFAAVAHGDDPDFPEIIRGELGQKLELDGVLAKCLLIFTQTETVEPGRDVHANLPFAVVAASGKPTANRDAWRMRSAGWYSPGVALASNPSF